MEAQSRIGRSFVTLIITIELDKATLREKLKENNEGLERDEQVRWSDVEAVLDDPEQLRDLLENELPDELWIETLINSVERLEG